MASTAHSGGITDDFFSRDPGDGGDRTMSLVSRRPDHSSTTKANPGDLVPASLHRLERHIPGDRFHLERPVMKEAARRLSREVKKSPVQPHREPKPHKVRTTHNTVQPGAHAPQLIRLRRNPYPLDPGYFRKSKGGERAKIEPALRNRPNVGELVAESRREPRLSLPKPSEARARLESRPRPSLDAWLAGGSQ